MAYIDYTNQRATRNQELSPELIKALSFLDDMGIRMEVFSGGQPAKGSGLPRVGSVRHDHGNAADVYFTKDGVRLDWANPEHLWYFDQIVRKARQNGITGIGAGEGYMRPGSMHIGFGNEAIWGAGGKGENAAPWLRTAWNGGEYTGYVPTQAERNAGIAPAVQSVPEKLRRWFPLFRKVFRR